MAPRTARVPNEALLGGDVLTAEDNAALEANQAAEHEPQLPLEDAPEDLRLATPPDASPEAPKSDEEPEHDDDAPEPTAEQRQRKVDYGALHAERQKRKASDAELQKAREEIARFNGRFETLQQIAQRQTQQDPNPQAQTGQIEIPDINSDPVGHFEAKTRVAEQKIQQFEAWQRQQEQERTSYSNVQRLTEIAQTHESEFSKTNTDYPEAFTYLRNMRDQELQAMGYKDPAARKQIINNDALQIAAQALQQNMNAAEVVYNIAKSRGYSKPAAVPAPAAPSPDKTKLETVQKGQNASQSLGQVPGSAPKEGMDINKFLAMSDEDFAKVPDAEWRKMMGG